jgi:hypothetical protein
VAGEKFGVFAVGLEDGDVSTLHDEPVLACLGNRTCCVDQIRLDLTG